MTPSHVTLAVVLLDGEHRIKGMAQAQGEPRYASRTAGEAAVSLLQGATCTHPRVAIIPAGNGLLGPLAERAIAFSKAGLSIDDLDQVPEMGRRAAVVAICGKAAARLRLERLEQAWRGWG